jgi:hypothetical protein
VIADTRRQERERAHSTISTVLVPVGLGFVLVLPTIVWIALDRSVWPWDPAWYGEVTFDLWSTLSDAPKRWPYAMTTAFGAKPPGVAWLGQFFVPFGSVVGAQRALLASIVACQIGSLAMIYVALRRLAVEPACAFAGTLLLAASPLFVWMTHEYFAEGLLTLVVAWSLLLLTLSGRTSNPVSIAAQLPGLLAIGMLAKLSSPLYLGVPVASTAVFLGRSMLTGSVDWPACVRSPRAITAAIASALAVVGAASWYRRNLDSALEHARIAQTDNGYYGTDRGLWTELSEWTTRFSDTTFLPAVAVGIGLIFVVALGWKLVRGDRPRPTRRVIVATVCAIQIAIVVLAFSSQPNEEARFLLPAVPFVAVTVALAVSNTPRPVVACTVALLCFEFLFVNLQQFGAAPIDDLSYYRLTSPQRDPTLRSTLQGLVDMTCTDRSNGRFIVVGAEHPWFNANTLALMASERNSSVKRKCLYTSLGLAESNAARAWERIVALDPTYYVALDYGAPRNPLPRNVRVEAERRDLFNQVNRSMLNRVNTSKGFSVVPGSRRGGFIVFEQVAPLG